MINLNKHKLRRIRIRRGFNAQRPKVVFEEGEPAFIKDKKSVWVGDNKKYGGILQTTKNHIQSYPKIPELANTFDIVIARNENDGYIIDSDNTLRKIFDDGSDISQFIKHINWIVDDTNRRCCNPDFRLITDSGEDILLDNGDWISIKSNTVCLPPVDKKPEVEDTLKWVIYMAGTIDKPIEPNDIDYKVQLGGTVIFTVSAVGQGNISYQYYKQNTNNIFEPIAGANSDTYTIVDIKTSDLTGYRCVASSTVLPSITSSIVTLFADVGKPSNPKIPLSWNTQPVDISVQLGDVATFTVNAVSNDLISYQWYKSNSPYIKMVGENKATLRINSVSNLDAAKYQCVAYTNNDTISSNEVTLTLKAPPPPPPPHIAKPANDTTDYTTYSDYILYTAKNFKIYTLIKKSANFSNSVIDTIKDAINRWSLILKDTVLPEIDQSSLIQTAKGYELNPLKFKNDGYVLVIDNEILKNPDGTDDMTTLAMAGPDYIRVAPNQRYDYIPSSGYAIINKNTQDNASKKIIGIAGKSQLYGVVLHEIGHALGIGVMWFIKNTPTKLRRSFIVGAGDNSTNPLYGKLGNIFYTIDIGPEGSRRAETDVMDTTSYNNSTLSTRGDAAFTYAYNPNTPTGTTSQAVVAYNQAFGLNLSAIPLENGLNIGSYGGHWAEGGESLLLLPSETAGSDNRQYNGNAYPGAPAMQDELMTPRTPINLSEMPLSKITIGGLNDLGWTADSSLADNYEPLIHVIRYTSNGVMYEVKKNNFGAFFPCHQSATNPQSTNFEYFLHLRRGLTYKFINETGEVLKIYDLLGNQLTSGVSNETIGTVKILKYEVPTNLNVTNSTIIIRGPFSTTIKKLAQVYWAIA